jgi:hypothetical protein
MLSRTLATVALLPAILVSGGADATSTDMASVRDNFGDCRHVNVGFLQWVHEFAESEMLSQPIAEVSPSVLDTSVESATSEQSPLDMHANRSVVSSVAAGDDEHGEEYLGEIEGEWIDVGNFKCHVVMPFYQYYEPHCSEHGVTRGKVTSHEENASEELSSAILPGTVFRISKAEDSPGKATVYLRATGSRSIATSAIRTASPR